MTHITSLTRSLRSLVRDMMCHSLIKPISKCNPCNNLLIFVFSSKIISYLAVKVKPIIVVKSAANQVAPPLELGTFTPKACTIQKPETDLFLDTNGSVISMGCKSGDGRSCKYVSMNLTLSIHRCKLVLSYSRSDEDMQLEIPRRTLKIR